MDNEKFSISLGSLFDGIGGFPYAASFYGIKTLWASEIVPAAISVTRRHFPDIEHVGDITKLKGGELTPVDIITFGSPCQSFSIAGQRTGLEGKSGLFWEAIRIIREMREATNGKYPRYCVFENVPGILSANKGRDYKTVLEAFTEKEIPFPKSGRWTNAGMVRGGRIDLAWVIHDAQHFGVAQRRRRLFLVCDFTGQRAAEILFKPKSLHRHFTESCAARKGITPNAFRSVDGAEPNGITPSNCLTPWDTQQSRVFTNDGTSPTLAGADGGGGRNPGGLVFAAAFLGGQSGAARSIAYNEELSPTLKSDAGGNTVPCVCELLSTIINLPIANIQKENEDDKPLKIGINGNVSATLDFSYYKGVGSRGSIEREVVLCRATGQSNSEIFVDKSPTLNCTCEQPIICIYTVCEPRSCCEYVNKKEDNNTSVVVVNDQGGDSLNIEKTALSPTLRSEAHGNLPIVSIVKHNNDNTTYLLGYLLNCKPINERTTAGGNQTTSTLCASYGTKWNGNSGAFNGDNFVAEPVRCLKCGRDVFYIILHAKPKSDGEGENGVISAGFIARASAKAGSIGYQDEISPTIRAGQNVHVIVKLIDKNICCERCACDIAVGIHQSPEGDIRVSKKAYTLTTNSGASSRNAPLICEKICAFSLDSTESNSMKYDKNPHSGCQETETARKLDTTNPCLSKNQGGIAIVCVHPEIAGTLVASGAGLSRPAGMASETDLCIVTKENDDPNPLVCGTLCAKSIAPNGIGNEADMCILQEPHTFTHLGFGHFVESDKSKTILQTDKVGTSDVVAYCLQGNMIGREDKNGPQGDGINEGISFTLNTIDRHCVAAVFNRQRSDLFRQDDLASTQTARQHKDATDLICQKSSAVDCRNLCETEEVSGTLQAKSVGGGYSLNYQNPVRRGFIVRRLTPVECERLQGYPDSWTEYGHDGKPLCDTARYQALGNSVAIPCVAYVISGIVDEFDKK